jgi:ABC-type dipeptide/oligopeptide/nickel transport system permease subunit
MTLASQLHEDEAAPPPVRRSGLARAARLLWNDKPGLIALLFIVAVTSAAIFAPLVAPADPYATALRYRLLSPGSTGANGFVHWLGTDSQGRDMLSRIIFGTRSTLLIGLSSVVIGGGMGATLGLLAAYYQRLDGPIMRFVDVLLSFPSVLFGLTVAAILKPGLASLIIALSISAIPTTARIARSAGLVVMKQEYMEAGRAMGLGDFTLLTRYLAANCLTTIMVYLTLKFGQIVLLGASLSFLGLGPQPPVAELGTMAADGRRFLQGYPFISTIPATVIFLIVLAFNIVGDSLRDITNER